MSEEIQVQAVVEALLERIAQLELEVAILKSQIHQPEEEPDASEVTKESGYL